MEYIPYIGITDFTKPVQVARMLGVLRKHRKEGQPHMLHVGVMMSYKTLHGIQCKWSKVFPPNENVERIFQREMPKIYNCLHYADYQNVTESIDLTRAIWYAGRLMNALQLDMPWPDPEIVEEAIRDSGANLEIILQISGTSIEIVGNNPQKVVSRLVPYRGIVHRVLLDKSMGRGFGLNAHELLPYARAIRDSLPEFGLGVAGGLGPDSINLVEPFLREFPDISIDAQSKLRPSGDTLDPIDWGMAEKYLIKALDLLGRHS